MEDVELTLATWVDKYGKIAAYTSAVVILTAFLIRFDTKFGESNKRLEELSHDVQELKIVVRDRDKYERWNKGINARMKRLFNKNGWEYDEVE